VSDTVSYVYAVVRDADERAIEGIRGVGGASVRLVGAGDLRAVVSDADRSEFEERALDERLEDLAWLTTTARAHHRVVDTVGRTQLVAPLSLATVYYGDDRVREILHSGREAFGQVLDRLAGRSEWGVKAYVRPRTERSGRSGPDDAARPRSGADYLRQRRDALRNTEAESDEERREADEVHRAVAELAVDDRRLRLQDATLAETSDRMVLNGAYLVPTASAPGVAALVDSFRDHTRLRVELTGPWVPYSFAQAAGP